MAVFLSAKSRIFRLGVGKYLWCFFSTVSANLEPNGRGTRFIRTIKDLCDNSIVLYENLEELKEEIDTIESELSNLPIDKVVFDIDNPGILPPWQPDEGVNNLKEYFTKKIIAFNIFTVFNRAITRAKELKSSLELVAM